MSGFHLGTIFRFPSAAIWTFAGFTLCWQRVFVVLLKKWNKFKGQNYEITKKKSAQLQHIFWQHLWTRSFKCQVLTTQILYGLLGTVKVTGIQLKLNGAMFFEQPENVTKFRTSMCAIVRRYEMS